MRISTRWRSPTDSCQIRARGSTRRPWASASAADLGVVLVEPEPDPRPVEPDEDVLGDRHRPDQREVLVDHPEARGDRVARRAERHRPAVDEDLPVVGLVEPVEDAHQGALAGAVLAEQGVDLARGQREVDAVVGDDARETA